LTGPTDNVSHALRHSKELHSFGGLGRGELWPVFLPSRARAATALLNLETDHCLGSEQVPPVYVVVQHEHLSSYRDKWSQTLTLSYQGQGPGYVRYVIQMACQCGYVKANDAVVPFGGSKAIVFDDSVSCFYSLNRLTEEQRADANRFNVKGNCKVQSKRDADTKYGFRRAIQVFMDMPCFENVAIGGFLRDDGLCCTKKRLWDTDTVSIYKAVVLNINVLAVLQVPPISPYLG
jgi:hypothetical protein